MMIVLGGLALVLVLISAAFARPVVVRVRNDFFDPGFKRINRGRVVKWVNRSGDEHTVSAWKGPWSKHAVLSGNGETTRKRFRRVGTYKYRCRFHSSLVDGGRRCRGMCGTIRVRRRG